jgi:hypothetical protein
MAGQFLKAALAFNHFPDPTYWYKPGIPLLRYVTAVFMVFGLVYSMVRWRRLESFLLSLWFWLVILFGGALMENPPTSPRLVMAIPPVVLFVVLGMRKLAGYVQRLVGWKSGASLAIATLLVVLTSYQSAHFYFAQYTPSGAFAGPNTEVADRMGKYLQALGPDYRAYFFGAPRMYLSFATIPFIARDLDGYDVNEPLRARPDFVAPNRKAVFIFLPERRGELDFVRQAFPSGRLREFHGVDGKLLFVAYESDEHINAN